MNDPCTAYEERAAILEFDACLSRDEAERLARIQLGEGRLEQVLLAIETGEERRNHSSRRGAR